MSGIADRSPVLTVDGAFASSWEHLAEELRCLDLRLRMLLLTHPPNQTADPLAAFRGLVVTDTEVSVLLGKNLTAGDSAQRNTEEEQETARELDDIQNVILGRRAAARQAGLFLSLPRLADLFNLTRFEEECLIVCLAPEVDRKYEKLYAYVQNDATRRRPGIDLVLSLLCRNEEEKLGARAAFDSSATLQHFKLVHSIEAGSDTPLLSRTLKLDDRIVAFLLCHAQLDVKLERFARLILPHGSDAGLAASHELYGQTSSFLQAHFQEPQSVGRNVVLYLHGPADGEKRLVVEAICRNFGLPLLIADVEAMMAGPLPFDQVAWLLGREAALQSAVLCLDNMECLLSDTEKHQLQLNSLLAAAKTFSRLTFILGRRHWQPQGVAQECVFLSVAAPRPDLDLCRRLWEHSLATCEHLESDVDSAVLAGKFRFGLSQIQDALATAESLARWRSPEKWQITASDIAAACRRQSSPKLSALAHKIEPRYSWSEIVLPDENLAQLKEMCQQARHRHLVYGEWGFDRKLSLGKGLNALFSGPPGTGKTMAAEVIANELQLDLYRIDLSQVVSKYIGETEKNLHQIFQEAEASHAILFFDEADALFGKRSEVKDAHDRYANIEVGYLLQKMEEYEGVAILATNLRQHIDDAFLRRMHFIIEFPFPDHEHRRQIWQVVFPREAPLAEDLDFDVLAREIKLAGGNIKNIALAAAFYAADDGKVIRMPHLWQAARREHQKLGRTWREAELAEVRMQ